MNHPTLAYYLRLCGLALLFLYPHPNNSLQLSTVPPLIDVPAFSLSTLGKDRTHDTMNILTYASPVSIQPCRMWSISLYKGTLSHQNFARERRGVLQLLTPYHVYCRALYNDNSTLCDQTPGALIRLLGGTSGRDRDKRSECEILGYAWRELDFPEADSEAAKWPSVIPGCLYYLQLELVADMIDCGSHEVALCRVVSMIVDNSIENSSAELEYLSTRKLREMGIISELGRIISAEP